MRLPRMTTRRWMIVTAVVALDCAGLFCGPDRLAAFCVVTDGGGPRVSDPRDFGRSTWA